MLQGGHSPARPPSPHTSLPRTAQDPDSRPPEDCASLGALPAGPAQGDLRESAPAQGKGRRPGRWHPRQSVPAADRAGLGLLSWAVASSSSGEDFFKKQIYLFAYGIKGTFSGLFLLLCDPWGGAPPLLAGRGGCCPSVPPSLRPSLRPGALSVLTRGRWQGQAGVQVWGLPAPAPTCPLP